MPKVKGYNRQREEMQKAMEHALIDKGWDREHLAKICGISQQRVSAIFKCPENLNFATLCRIYKKLGIKEIVIV